MIRSWGMSVTVFQIAMASSSSSYTVAKRRSLGSFQTSVRSSQLQAMASFL